MLLTVIAYHADKDGGNSYPSLNTMQEQAALSERSVWYALKQLVELGELVLSGRGYLADREHPYSLGEALVRAVAIEDDTQQMESANIAPQESAKSALMEDRVQNLHPESAKSALALNGIKRPLNVHKESSLPPPGVINPRETGGDGGRVSVLPNRTGAYAALHAGACLVLNRRDLTAAQHDQVTEFHDRYCQDTRLNDELVQYAASICQSKDKADLRYWLGILAKRMKDPAWVDVTTELEGYEQKKGKEGLNGTNGFGTGGQLGDNRGGSKPRALWDSEAIPSSSPGLMAEMERHIAANGRAVGNGVHPHEGGLR